MISLLKWLVDVKEKIPIFNYPLCCCILAQVKGSLRHAGGSIKPIEYLKSELY